MRKKCLALVGITLATAITLGTGRTAFTAAKHPQIHAAMRALRNATDHIERAADIYGGHRAKAMELVRQAENELQQALAYADLRPKR